MERLGRYTLIERLGSGGMAEVYVARRDHTSRLSALKRLQPELKAHPTGAARFLREAHVASLLDHPNLARVLGASEEGGAFCIEMELIAGVDLAELGASFTGRGALVPASAVVSIALSALAGLAHAHEARGPDRAPLGLVHRDLSPRNVMVDVEGRVKIIDFGVARAEVDRFKTAPGMIVGSLRYFSPEQARAEPVDARSDLYSLSVTLFELFTGRERVRSAGPFEVLRAVCDDPAPLASELAPVPRAIAEVLARGLEKEAGERWPSAAAYREALAAAAATAGMVVDGERALRVMVRSGFPARLEALERWRSIARGLAAAEPAAGLEALGTGSELEAADTGTFEEHEETAASTHVRTRLTGAPSGDVELPLEDTAIRDEPTYVASEITDLEPRRAGPRSAGSALAAPPRLGWIGGLVWSATLLAVGSGGTYAYMTWQAPPTVVVAPPPNAAEPSIEAQPPDPLLEPPAPVARTEARPAPIEAPAPKGADPGGLRPARDRSPPPRSKPRSQRGAPTAEASPTPTPTPAGPTPTPPPAESAASAPSPLVELERELRAKLPLHRGGNKLALVLALTRGAERLPTGPRRAEVEDLTRRFEFGGDRATGEQAIAALIKALAAE